MLKKIKREILKYWYVIEKLITHMKMSLKFIFCKSKFGVYHGNKRNENIIVSLTSFPGRIDKIHLCIKALLLQEIKPDKIILYLGEDEFKNIELPSNLLELKKFGLEIRFRKDLKPHTKYYYAMQEFPDAAIVTVDDDAYYSRSLVGDLYNAHTKYPNQVICTRAHKIRTQDGVILPYAQWDYETKDIVESSHYLMATGVGGVLYPAKVFPQETFNEERIIALSLRQDDVWLKVMEIIGGIKVHAIPSKKTSYVVGIWGSEKIALFKSNVGCSDNDLYIRQVFSYYSIDETKMS